MRTPDARHRPARSNVDSVVARLQARERAADRYTGQSIDALRRLERQMLDAKRRISQSLDFGKPDPNMEAHYESICANLGLVRNALGAADSMVLSDGNVSTSE